LTGGVTGGSGPQPASRDAAGRTLEFVHSIYRGDRYQIVSELTPS
jgi:hypothetical protein